VGSIHRLELGFIGSGDGELLRATEIVAQLRRSDRPVEGDGPIWHVSYADLEDRETATEALKRDLDHINSHWSEVLSIG
jgi:hypothetical protein